jgi:hypothetical protein
MIFSDGSQALSSSWHASVNIWSSDISDEDREKCNDARSIPRMNMEVFILVQALSWSNSPRSSLIVINCEI